MKVELSIADDRELRAHIKDVIKGEVLSIARGEIRGIIAQALAEKAIPQTAEAVDRIVRDAIKEEIKNSVKGSYGKPNYIQVCIREEIEKYLIEFFSKSRSLIK